MKQIEVQIMGHSYILTCPVGGEAKMYEAVRRVDNAMCKIRDTGKVRARDRIAVLAALNLAFDLPEKGNPADNSTQEIGADGVSVSATAPTSTSTSTPTLATSPADEALLRSLVQRLDTALGQDGQLL